MQCFKILDTTSNYSAVLDGFILHAATSQVKNTPLIFTNLEWASNVSHKFYNAYLTVTDYGACCLIAPYLDFVNPETVYLDPSNYTAEHFHSIPLGTKNGVTRGLKLVMDVESFDYAYYPRSSRGFKIAIADARDKAVISQDGYYIRPGKHSQHCQPNNC